MFCWRSEGSNESFMISAGYCWEVGATELSAFVKWAWGETAVYTDPKWWTYPDRDLFTGRRWEGCGQGKIVEIGLIISVVFSLNEGP